MAPATVATLPTQAAVSTVLTVTAPTTYVAKNDSPDSRPLFPAVPGTTLAAALCLWGWRKRGRVRVGLLVAAMACALPLLSGCSTTGKTQVNTVTVAMAGDSVRITPTFTLTELLRQNTKQIPAG